MTTTRTQLDSQRRQPGSKPAIRRTYSRDRHTRPHNRPNGTKCPAPPSPPLSRTAVPAMTARLVLRWFSPRSDHLRRAGWAVVCCFCSLVG
jgi:hypothetical protein